MAQWQMSQLRLSFVGRREVIELPSPPKVGRPPKVREQEEKDNEAKPKRKRGRPPVDAVDAERYEAILGALVPEALAKPSKRQYALAKETSPTHAIRMGLDSLFI